MTRRTVPVNAMMANSIPPAALLAVPILSTIHVPRSPQGRLEENSEKSKKLVVDLPIHCKFVASAAMFLSPAFSDRLRILILAFSSLL